MSKIKVFLKALALLLSALCVLLFIFMGWVKYRSLGSNPEGLPLAIRWEGFYHDMNHRDVGASLNQCLGKRLFREEVLHRSAGWFSGWSCEKVGSPEVIYSLNYSPSLKERYFCHVEGDKNIGRYFNPDLQLNDLEFMESWEHPAMRGAACRFLDEILSSMIAEKKILLHCDAGRDRTGALTALLVAMAAQAKGELHDEMINAIECDYRKTESLVPEKYGRMQRFIKGIGNRGSVAEFLQNQCGISEEKTLRAASQFNLN